MKKFLLFAALVAGCLTVSAHQVSYSWGQFTNPTTIDLDCDGLFSPSTSALSVNGTTTIDASNYRLRIYSGNVETFYIPYVNEDDEYQTGYPESFEKKNACMGNIMKKWKKKTTASPDSSTGVPYAEGSCDYGQIMDADGFMIYFFDFNTTNVGGDVKVTLTYNTTVAEENARDIEPFIIIGTTAKTMGSNDLFYYGLDYDLPDFEDINLLVGYSTEAKAANGEYTVEAELGSPVWPYWRSGIHYAWVIFPEMKADEKAIVKELKIEATPTEESMVGYHYEYWDLPQLIRNGATYVQAEDWDIPEVNDRIAHSHFATENPYSNSSYYRGNSRRGEDERDWDVWLPTGKTAFGYSGNHDISLQFGEVWVYGWNQYPDWNVFHGEAPQGADGKKFISLEQAFDEFGGWLEYTFESPRDMEFDLHMRQGGMYKDDYSGDITYTAVANWYEQGYMLGTVEEGEDGTPVPASVQIRAGKDTSNFYIHGLEDYFQTYAGNLVVYLDDQPLKTNWNVRPPYQVGWEWAQFQDAVKTPSCWLPNTTVNAAGEEENSVLFQVIPWVGTTAHEYDSGVRGSNNGKLGGQLFQEIANYDEATEEEIAYFNRPDYANVPVTKGRHVLKFKTLSPVALLDYFCLMGHDATGLNPNPFGELPKVEVPAPEQPTLTDAEGNELNILLEGDKVHVEVPYGHFIHSTWTTSLDNEPAKAPVKTADGYTWEVTNHNVADLEVPAHEGTEIYLHVKAVNPVTGEESEPSVIQIAENGETTGLQVAQITDENAPAIYYNLHGQRVQNPSNGIFIRRQGSNTSKVIFK